MGPNLLNVGESKDKLRKGVSHFGTGEEAFQIYSCQFHSMPTRGGSYSMTMLQSYYLYEVSLSSNGTSDEEDSHSNDEQGMVENQEA
jgi:hypothetical protein